MGRKKQDKLACDLYTFLKEYALLKLDDETKRYESLLHQASNMQSAFSFATAALFMVAPIAVEYKGKMSYLYLLIVFSSITIPLLASLFFAAMAQSRKDLRSFADIQDVLCYVTENYTDYLSKAQRAKALVEQISEIQLSASKKNNEMATKIRWSMYFFYAAIILSAIWFFISFIVLFF